MKPKIVLVVAAAQVNRVIGKSNNELPWPRISGDMQNFRKETLGHPVIMGRVTFETFPINPKTGLPKPLPKRLNIVITRNTDYKVPEGVLLAHSIEEALELANKANPEKICIIGGEQIYVSTIDMADEISYTEIKLVVFGTTKFPKIPISFKKVSKEWHSENVLDDDRKITIHFEIQRWIKR